MKVIAFYLPQFHSFPENDEWWGKGFTEWTNTKKTKPAYKGHYQPREPLNDNYYDLLNPETFKWQISLAKQYGIYGFCFYQYWFGDGHKLMEKPLEMFLNNKEYNIHFCISWANESWTRAWDGKTDVIMPQDYGDKKAWKDHFEYLYPFFCDERYIVIDGKPLFILYKPEIFPQYQEMFDYWDELAKDKGLPGLSFGIQGAIWNNTADIDDSKIDLRIMYEPGYTGSQPRNKRGIRIGIYTKLYKIRNTIKGATKINMFSYDAYSDNILNRQVESDKFVPGYFVDWDNSPRRGAQATIFYGSTPQKFKTNFAKLIRKTRTEYKKDMIFLNAWNEWAEGCYLEPDKNNKYAYLEAVRDALIENDEFNER